MKTQYLREYLRLPSVQQNIRARHMQKALSLSTGKRIYDDSAETVEELEQTPAGTLNVEVNTAESAVQGHTIEPHFSTRSAPSEVAWPEGVQKLRRCIYAKDLKNVTLLFPDIGKMDACRCSHDCFRDTCKNATTDIFCSKSIGALIGRCSNTAYEYGGVELMQCEYGIGVRATEFIPVDAVIGEFVGELTLHDFEADMEIAEYALELQTTASTTKIRKKRTVYIDAAKAGSITRFINHSCEAKCKFVEVRNGRRVKVLVIVENPFTLEKNLQ